MKRREFVSTLATASLIGAAVPTEVLAAAPANPALSAIKEVAGEDFIRVSLGVGYLPGITGRHRSNWDVVAARIAAARDQLSRLGIVFPVTRFVDNLSLADNAYTISVYGQIVHQGVTVPASELSAGNGSDRDTIAAMDLILDQLIAVAQGGRHLWPADRVADFRQQVPR